MPLYYSRRVDCSVYSALLRRVLAGPQLWPVPTSCSRRVTPPPRCRCLFDTVLHNVLQALQYMRGSREVQPNYGFLQQLAVKDNELRKDRHRKYNYKLEEIKYSI